MNTRVLLVVLVAGSHPACMTAYHPLRGLQAATVVDPSAQNFPGTSIEIACLEGGAVDRKEADRLCDFVRTLFKDQGAEIRDRAMAKTGELDRSKVEPDLILELRSRTMHRRVSYSSYALSLLTLTLVPAARETSVAQTAAVYDAAGHELARDTYEWRMRESVGIGIWSVNWLLDSVARDDENELTGSAPKERFSRDFYRQVTQLVFNAHQRLKLLRYG